MYNPLTSNNAIHIKTTIATIIGLYCTYVARAGVAMSVCTPIAIGMAPQFMLPNSSAMATL